MNKENIEVAMETLKKYPRLTLEGGPSFGTERLVKMLDLAIKWHDELARTKNDLHHEGVRRQHWKELFHRSREKTISEVIQSLRELRDGEDFS